MLLIYYSKKNSKINKFKIEIKLSKENQNNILN